MAIDFKQAYAGITDATPDGHVPKINDRDDENVNGVYYLKIVESESFDGKKGGLTFKLAVKVLGCDNGRFRPDTDAAILIPGLSGSGFGAVKKMGNVRELLASCLSSILGHYVDPKDPEQDWLEIINDASVIPDSLEGATIRVQCSHQVAENKNAYVKMVSRAMSDDEVAKYAPAQAA